MCNAASFVLTKDNVFWSKTSNSHEEIIVGTIQITRWYSDVWKVATRVVTEAEANKPYRVVGGVWTLLNQ